MKIFMSWLRLQALPLSSTTNAISISCSQIPLCKTFIFILGTQHLRWYNLPRTAEVRPCEWPCDEFLRAAGIYEDFHELAQTAGLTTFLHDQCNQYLLLTNTIVQNFHFHSRNSAPTVEFHLYDEHKEMSLHDFCRVCLIPFEGSVEEPHRDDVDGFIDTIVVGETRKVSDARVTKIQACEWPSVDFLRAARIYEDFHELAKNAGLTAFLHDQCDQYLLLTNTFVQNFHFHSRNSPPTMEFHLYDEHKEMSLYDFCRVCLVPFEGKTEEPHHDDVEGFINTITVGETRKVSDARITSIHFPVLRYFAIFSSRSLIGRGNCGNVNGLPLIS